MIITFLGHSLLVSDNKIFELVKKEILNHIDICEKTYFYCGGYGDFDNICASVCRELKSSIPLIDIVLITLYLRDSYLKGVDYLILQNKYDYSLYPPLEHIPPKFCIAKRNEWMVEAADLVITYIDHRFGGAYNAFCYAIRKKKRIINLGSLNLNK